MWRVSLRRLIKEINNMTESNTKNDLSIRHAVRSGRAKTMKGTVVGDKADKTVTVLVERYVMHPKYKKYYKRSKKYKAHDELNKFHTGDIVSIVESRPISKDKHYKVVGGDTA